MLPTLTLFSRLRLYWQVVGKSRSLGSRDTYRRFSQVARPNPENKQHSLENPMKTKAIVGNRLNRSMFCKLLVLVSLACSTSGCAVVGIATAIGCDTVTAGMMSEECAEIGELFLEY